MTVNSSIWKENGRFSCTQIHKFINAVSNMNLFVLLLFFSQFIYGQVKDKKCIDCLL
jgi:hypothetical protein